jgi:hypothetical protein
MRHPFSSARDLANCLATRFCGLRSFIVYRSLGPISNPTKGTIYIANWLGVGNTMPLCGKLESQEGRHSPNGTGLPIGTKISGSS